MGGPVVTVRTSMLGGETKSRGLLSGRRSTGVVLAWGVAAVVCCVLLLFWQLAGTALLVRHGVTTRRILHDRELNEQRVHHLTTRSDGTTD